MGAHYNANSQQATRRASGPQFDDSRRTGNDSSFVAHGHAAVDPSSVIPRSHPAPASPYGPWTDPGSATAYEAPSRVVYGQNTSPYLTQPNITTPTSLHQSPPRSSSLTHAPGNYYTLRSGQLGQPGDLSNLYAPQSPGIDNITAGIGGLTTSPSGPRWPTTPGPSDSGYATGVAQSIQPTSRGRNVPQNVISGTSSTHNTTLDARYVVQKNPKNFFKVGRVFAILWHENEGSTGRGTQSYISEGPVYMGRFNELVHSGIRRMVVVKALDQCAWCFPVSTYSRKGVAKAGVDPSKHAVIYMQGTEPQVGSSEPHMTKEPLEVAPASPDQKLDFMSRLNFGKVYTVEHNVKVLPVGKITERSMPRFQSYAKNEFNIMP